MSKVTPVTDSVDNPIMASLTIKDKAYRDAILIRKQIPVPWVKNTHLVAPWFLKADSKIAKYDMSGLHIWRALFSFSHTILGDLDTWYHLGYLTIICFITMAVVYYSGSYLSVDNNSDLTSRTQLLLSFVLAGYISIVINRWDRVRNTTLGQLWGAVESTCQISFRVLFSHGHGQQEMELSELIIRYARLSMRLTFMAVQAVDDLSELQEQKLITSEEREWLQDATIGTRPLIVVSWIDEFFRSLTAAGYGVIMSDSINVVSHVASIRGGIGATLGLIGSQLPYPYVHVIYWIVQIMLMALAIQTGVALAVNINYSKNGDNAYSPADDNTSWPASPSVWYANQFMTLTAGNIVFALFTEGLLKITEKLNNPLSDDDTSFSDIVFDSFLYNNCIALRAGYLSYSSIAAIKIKPVLGSPEHSQD
eukprot:gene31306-41725_t